MRICYVLDNDPAMSTGGTPIVVSYIRRYTGGDIMHGSRNILLNIILMLILPFRISAGRYDIVNIHDTHGYFYTFWPKRKKTVYTCHNLWKNYHRAVPPRSLNNRLKARISVFLEKRLLTKSDHITTVSSSVRTQIIGEYEINPEKITAIHNGVDTIMFKPGKKGDAFIWVGNNPELKGLQKAIDYSRKKNRKLIVIGIKGDSTKNVKYMGMVENSRMPCIYLMADTLLFFSKTEGHPLVPLEAAACGLNLIATKESNLEIFPLKNGAYNVDGRDAIKISRKYDWKLRSMKYSELFCKILKG